jgi:hypothetical protein
MSKFKPVSGTTLPAVRPRVFSANTPDKPPSISEPSDSSESSSPDTVFQAASQSPIRGFAFNCTLVFLFFRFSFLHEFVQAKTGIDTHILLILGFLSYATCFFGGAAFSGLQDKSTWMWLGFATCMCLATYTSFWRGGSFAIIFPYLRTTLPFILLIPAVTFTAVELKRLLNTIGIAGMTTIVIGLTSNDFTSGRMDLDSASGSIGNSNDYAAYMLLVLPAIAYFAFGKGRNIVFKLLGSGAIALGFYQFLSTGSRGGLVSLIVTGLYILKHSSAKVRIAVLVGLPLLAAVAIPFVPSESRTRLASLFSSSDQIGEAQASQEERTQLLIASLHATATHPLLGVGPGEFMDYEGDIAKANGRHGMWHQSHNGYTQVSSECGIPAVLFYISAMILTFLSLWKSSKSKNTELAPLAYVVMLMMVSFSICLIFLSQAYTFSLPVLTGVAVAIQRLVKQQGESTAIKVA